MPHHYSSVTILAAVAFGVAVVVTPTGVSSFSVSNQMAEPASASASRLFRKRSSGRLHRTWNYSSDGTVEDSSLITLRGGSGSSDAESTPIDSNTKSTTTTTTTTTTNRTPVSGASEAYYLVWSKGFVPKLAFATALLAVFRWQGWDHTVMEWCAASIRLPAFGFVPPGLVPNVVLPLLSSSCCAIQLAVNALSVVLVGAGAGCLGFNTVLGPLRPYLMAVLVACHTSLSMPPSLSMLARYAIALLPEVVFGWNAMLRSRWKRAAASSTSTSSSTSANNGKPEQVVKATLIVEVPTMGCVACVNKIETSLRNCAPEHIETASSWLNDKPKEEGKKKGGLAQIEVTASSVEELDDLAKRFVGAIDGAGFQGSTIQDWTIHGDDSTANTNTNTNTNA